MLIRLADQLQGSDHLDISLDQMSRQMGIPRVTIQRSLKRLVQADYLLQSYTRPPGKKRLLSINETKLKDMVSQSRIPTLAASQRVISLYQAWLRFSDQQSNGVPENLATAFNKNTALLILAALTVQADEYQCVRGVSTRDLSKLTGASIEYINQTRRLLVRLRLISVLPGWHQKGIMDRPTSTYMLLECDTLKSTISPGTRVINAKFIDFVLQPMKVANLFNLKRHERLVHPELPNIEKTRNLQALDRIRAVAANAAELALFIYFKHHGINFTWISIPQKLDAFYREYAELLDNVYKSLGNLDKDSSQLLESISKAYSESMESFDTRFIQSLSFDEKSYLRSLAILVCEILLQSGWKHLESGLKEVPRVHEVRLANFPCTGARFQLLVTPDEL